MMGEPLPDRRQPISANLSSAFEANTRQTSSWSSARMLAQNAPEPRSWASCSRSSPGRTGPGPARARGRRTNRSAMPTGVPSLIAVTTVTPVGKWPEHLTELGVSKLGLLSLRSLTKRSELYGCGLAAGTRAPSRRRGTSEMRSPSERPAPRRAPPAAALLGRGEGQQSSTVSSSWSGSWWNSASRRAPGLGRDPHGVVDRAVAPRAPSGRELVGRVLGVVDQQVGTVAQLEHAVGRPRASRRAGCWWSLM